jgi:hypothetical protein
LGKKEKIRGKSPSGLGCGQSFAQLPQSFGRDNRRLFAREGTVERADSGLDAPQQLRRGFEHAGIFGSRAGYVRDQVGKAATIELIDGEGRAGALVYLPFQRPI